MKTIKLLFISTLISAALVACKKEEATPTEFYGESVTLGSGTAKSFYRTDDAGNPKAVGIAISEAALSKVLTTSASSMIPLPAEAQTKTPFKFILFDYLHAGHEPTMVYDKPHFDIHFYMTTNEERLKINPSDATAATPPADGFLPMPRIATGVVPQMGNHWVDVTSPELNGGKFNHTFIYGSAYGKITFYEPMITPEFIKATAHGVYPIKLPTKFEKSGSYPTEYMINYNAEAKQYEVTLETFVVK